MALVARLSIRHWGCIVSEGLTGGAIASHVSSDWNGDLVVMHGSEEAVERFVGNVHATQAQPPEVLLRASETVVMRLKTPDGGVFSTIMRSRCSVLWPATWQDGVERYTVLAGTREQLRSLREALSGLADVQVEEAQELDPGTLDVHAPLTGLAAGLTERQLGALQLAIGKGYYEHPRKTGTEELAKSLGISRTTFEEHLRKAQSRLFPRLGALLSAHPGLTEAAKAGRGRRPKSLAKFDVIKKKT